MSMTDTATRARGSASPLLRAVGFVALAAAIVNITVGGSIFALPGTLAAAMGHTAPLAFVLGALLFAPIVLCIAAAGSRVTSTGGPYSYVDAAFGRFPGFVMAGIFWISNVSGSGALAAVLADQLSHALPMLAQPLPRALFLLAVYGSLIVLNALGVRAGAAAIVAFAAAKCVPLLLFVLLGVHLVHPGNLSMTALPGWASIGSSMVLVLFAYSGIETALAPSGEVRDPARTVPMAALVGIAVGIGLYVSVDVIAQGVLGARLEGNMAPLPAVADLIFRGGGTLLVLTATVSLLGYLQGDLLGSSRLLYAMAENGFLPGALAVVSSKRRAPTRAVAMHALIAWCLAAAGSYKTLALVGGGAVCMVYIGCCAASWQLQRTNAGDTDHPFRLPGGPLIPMAGIAGLTLVLMALQRAEWLALGCAALAVIALYALALWLQRR
jgi:basic amino acid/polyamine antiporter, APA family